MDIDVNDSNRNLLSTYDNLSCDTTTTSTTTTTTTTNNNNNQRVTLKQYKVANEKYVNFTTNPTIKFRTTTTTNDNNNNVNNVTINTQTLIACFEVGWSLGVYTRTKRNYHKTNTSNNNMDIRTSPAIVNMKEKLQQYITTLPPTWGKGAPPRTMIDCYSK